MRSRIKIVHTHQTNQLLIQLISQKITVLLVPQRIHTSFHYRLRFGRSIRPGRSFFISNKTDIRNVRRCVHAPIYLVSPPILVEKLPAIFIRCSRNKSMLFEIRQQELSNTKKLLELVRDQTSGITLKLSRFKETHKSTRFLRIVLAVQRAAFFFWNLNPSFYLSRFIAFVLSLRILQPLQN